MSSDARYQEIPDDTICVTVDQVRTADLVNECIMFRDGLLYACLMRSPSVTLRTLYIICPRADC